MREILNRYISVKDKTDIFGQFGIKRYLFLVSISAYCLLLWRGYWLMNVNRSKTHRHLSRRGTYQHTVNANKLYTKALPESR